MKWIALLCLCVISASTGLQAQDGWPMLGGCRERNSWAQDAPQLRPPFDASVIALPAPYNDESGLYIDFMTRSNGIFYLGDEGDPCNVIAFEEATAGVLWRGDISGSGGAIGSCPAIVGDMVIAGGQGATSLLTGFHRLTGAVIWQRAVLSMYVKSPVPDGSRLYLKTDSMYCLDAATGKSIWTKTLSSFNSGSPAVDGTSVYYVAGDTLFARDKQNGELRWRSYDARKEGIAVDDARVYVSAPQAMRAVNKANGQELWRTPIADGKNAAYISASPLAVDDRFLIYSVWSNKDTVATLTCLDKVNGTERWTHIFPAEGCFAPTIAGGCVYVTTWKDNTFWALDVESGSVLMQDNSRRYDEAQSIEDGGVLYVASTASAGRGFRIVAFSPRQSGVHDAAATVDLTLDVYPQPVIRDATVTVRLTRTQDLHIELVDALGRRVTMIDEGRYTPGEYTRSFTLPAGTAAGLYCLRCVSGKDVRLKPILHVP